MVRLQTWASLDSGNLLPWRFERLFSDVINFVITRKVSSQSCVVCSTILFVFPNSIRICNTATWGITDYGTLFWEQVQNTESAIFVTLLTWKMLT